MADNETDVSKFDPKHRIIGAVILVSLAVIFIPMILDESSTPPELSGGTPAPSTPAAPGAPETRVVVTPVARLDAPAEPATEAAAAPTGTRPVAELATVPEAAPLAPRTESPKPVPAGREAGTARTPDTEPPARAGKHWVVQVGVYSHADNARRVQDKLQAAGFHVISDNVKVGGEKAVRLRVGSYPDKAAAEKAQAQIQKQLGTTVLVRAVN
jgi:DedD protein